MPTLDLFPQAPDRVQVALYRDRAYRLLSLDGNGTGSWCRADNDNVTLRLSSPNSEKHRRRDSSEKDRRLL